MGEYQIWHIEFKDKESRKYFEKLKLHQRILYSFCEWKDKCGEGVYFMGIQGYYEGQEFLKKHIKKLNIKKFHSLDLTTRSTWSNELLIYKRG